MDADDLGVGEARVLVGRLVEEVSLHDHLVRNVQRVGFFVFYTSGRSPVHALNPFSLSSSVIPPHTISSKFLPSQPPHALHCPTQTSLLTFSLEKTGPCPPLTWKEFQFRTRSQVRSEDISADFLRMLGGMLRRNLYVSCARSFLGETASTPGAAFGGEKRGTTPWDETGVWLADTFSALSPPEYKADNYVGFASLVWFRPLIFDYFIQIIYAIIYRHTMHYNFT